ncbi:k+ transport nad-binding component [Leptolyngbya sp. Heron Island J]|uniref:potassium channel family protein n=1 Tax=Leptolyngbya sp. Heron Island J TaxID=1385935 RepID=UPI0003B9DCDB|nr:potassium channel protein [Leptolyngbya sp. Heron Island J]ESA34205.1 k+ transport nad-binding component [Leptolyngbya sp. Heron Island J]
MRSPRSSLSDSHIEETYQRTRRHLLGGAIALGCVVITGIFWYRVIEGWTWLDAAYMSVITLATVGFAEVQPLGARGRLFTIILILMGVVVIAYILNCFTEALIQGHLQSGIRLRQRRKLMQSLTSHYIICGFGRTGRQVATEFSIETIPFIVVDSHEASIQAAQQMGFITFQGDATLDHVLLQVGIERACGLVAALPSDAENLYTVLSAKTLAPNVRAIARASTEEAVQKLQRGGADVVVSPYITGGKRMAAAALRPQVVDFLDGILTGADRTVYIEEFLISPEHCPQIGKTLGETKLRMKSGALILAIRRADNSLIVGPNADTVLCSGDLVIALGSSDELYRLNQILGPIRRQY